MGINNYPGQVIYINRNSLYLVFTPYAFAADLQSHSTKFLAGTQHILFFFKCEYIITGCLSYLAIPTG